MSLCTCTRSSPHTCQLSQGSGSCRQSAKGHIVIAIPLSTPALILSSQTHTPALGCPAPPLLSQGPVYHFCLFLFCFVPLPASLLCPLEDSQRLQSATKEDSKDRAQWTPGSSHASACTSVWGKGSGYFIYLFIYPSCPAPHPASCRSPLGKMKNSLRQQQTRQTTWPPQFNFL